MFLERSRRNTACDGAHCIEYEGVFHARAAAPGSCIVKMQRSGVRRILVRGDPVPFPESF